MNHSLRSMPYGAKMERSNSHRLVRRSKDSVEKVETMEKIVKTVKTQKLKTTVRRMRASSNV